MPRRVQGQPLLLISTSAQMSKKEKRASFAGKGRHDWLKERLLLAGIKEKKEITGANRL
ncbi:MAG: hypothetical protein RI601_06565 [Desulfurivibrionaceae bacterium]|nr:hypothetical protein [Desulfurivibrionaceae bacterium]